MTLELPYLTVDDPKNAKLIRAVFELNWRPSPVPVSAVDRAVRPPFRGFGCYPDVVTHVWVTLGDSLPINCRCLIYGLPALVTPTTGIVLALAWGTNYIIRLPPAGFTSAIATNAKFLSYLTEKFGVDVSRAYGGDLMLGIRKIDEERRWCRERYDMEETRQI